MAKKEFVPKNKADKVKETITLLTKLKELGIPENEPGYTETKRRCDEWINGTEAWSGRIDFPRFGRRAELILPSREGRVSSMKLFAAGQ